MAPDVDRHPLLHQLNARLLRGPLDEAIDDAFLAQLQARRFTWLYLLGVWSTGTASRDVSRTAPNLLAEYEATLPGFTETDVCGSPFAITAYDVHPRLGGDAALARLRERMHAHGLKLMVDFVPNHVALDHPWRDTHPEYFIVDDDRFESTTIARRRYAYGRDPYSGAWRDTLQLNYAAPDLVGEMVTVVKRIADLADGIRCDMAMLELPDVFEQTWGRAIEPFWPQAIDAARDRHPAFVFMAEVYWDREYQMQQLGFDYTYDKAMYDRLLQTSAASVRGHLHAEPDYQRRSVRFIENHDEPRAAAALPLPQHRAAAVLSYLVPGLRFFHDGQWEGRRTKLSMHLCRRADEAPDPAIASFYVALHSILARRAPRQGDWRLLEVGPAWSGNPSHGQVVAFVWQHGDERLLAVVNYASTPAQGYVSMPFDDLEGRTVALRDLLSAAHYEREGTELRRRGLYIDVGPWRSHVFEVSP